VSVDTDGTEAAGDETDADADAGESTKRREDPALLTGRATFVGDRTHPDCLHLAFVRAEHAHADVAVDLDAARAVDGVVAAYAWDDVASSPSPGVVPVADETWPGHPILARGRVRYHGQPVAAVVAEDRYRARDGVAAAEVSYDTRPAVVDPRAARDEAAPTLFEGVPDNVVLTRTFGDGAATTAAFEAADRTVELDVENNRLAPTALEPRAAVAWQEGEELVVEMTSQSPHGHRRKLAATLGRPEQEIRVVSPSVGGGFGHKGHHHPGEAMAAWAAARLDRPVRWTATRRGNYLAGAHGRDHRTTAALAVDDDGTIRGLRAETDAAVGGYALGSSPYIQAGYGDLLSGQYAIPAIRCTARAVCTTTAPVHSYRGAGRPEAIYLVERLVDAAARELGVTPVEIRRRNLIPADAFPHETATGAVYDSGDYERALDTALDTVGYESLPERTADGRRVGVGVACFVESTAGIGHESALVRVHPDGSVTAYVGTHSHGQGHATTYAGIVAAELGVDREAVRVVEGDTERVPTGTGTFGSRSAVAGGNAVRESAARVRRQAGRVAAHELGVDPSAVVRDGEGFVADGRRVDLPGVAAAAYEGSIPDDCRPGLEATTFYEPEGTAYAFGTHVAVVAVDEGTGAVSIERYVAVTDCGRQLEPTVVEGQVHGGVAQGIGQARQERVVYDDDGRLVTDSMRRYAVPRAEQVPPVETASTVTPSPRNELGVKGVGESGTIAAPPAVVNAVVDAVDVHHLDMPVTDGRVWRALHGDGVFTRDNSTVVFE
jgi:carbon-monoxide dehydrogenase large subunit